MKRAAQDKRAKTGGKAAKRVKSGDAAPPAADHATQEHATQESEEAPAEFLFGVARSSVVGIRYCEHDPQPRPHLCPHPSWTVSLARTPQR
mmetsp:Transcript_17980/g.55006  ORF Transcript_17980/g.55006 Transcript_17980/m.55006 type:complete len:91 (+) Transcript_17980:171-443(+)